MSIQLSDHFTYKKLIKFVLPSIVMMIFTSIYGVVDGLFVSNFAGKTAFAAINLVMPFIMVLGGIGFMIGTGGTALVSKILGEGGKPVDCRIEDSKRTGEDFKKAKEALGDLARSEEDVMSYICYPDQAMKFFEDRKAKEENICTYVIEEA